MLQRLVEMTPVQFSDKPPLPKPANGSTTDGQIRLTPSTLGPAALSDKAIPYYYLQDGTPPLYRIWNYEKTRLDRAEHNLGYRSDEYTPAAPDFVTKALAYDLEPDNFLRIEGHLGKDFKTVLKTLLSLRASYRLPIDIIALRTGVFDKSIPVDLSQETCRLSGSGSLVRLLAGGASFPPCARAYYISMICPANSEFRGRQTQASSTGNPCPFPVGSRKGTMGGWFEKIKDFSVPYIDIDQSNIDDKDLIKIAKLLLIGTSGLTEKISLF